MRPFLALATTLLLTSTAQAQTVAYIPNERATHGEVVTRMGETALHYWRMNGIAGCDTLTIAPFDTNPAESLNVGYGGGCSVLIAEEHIEWIMDYRRPVINDRKRKAQRWSIRYVCRLMVHEAGHALGLRHQDHARFQIMGEFAEPHIPACGRLARELV